MVKVLIVDDEAIARMNLRCLIDWEKEGYVICGEADNGFDALKKVEELKPDIIFTDINMPGMSGSELVKKVRAVTPEAKVVAFSAFEDFEYVRQSLKEGALDYLLKYKVDAEALISLLNSIRESINQEYIEKQKITKIIDIASSGKVQIQKNVLLNVLNGYVQENFDELMKKYDIDLDGKNLVVAVAVIEEKDKFNSQESAVFKKTIDNILSNICAEMKKTEFVFLENGKLAFLMSFSKLSSEAQITSEVVSNLCEIENTVKKFLNIGMSFGVSNICPCYANIKHYYEEASTALEDGYYKGSSYIVQKNELSRKCEEQKNVRLSAADEKNIILYVRGLRKQELSRYIDGIFRSVQENKGSFNTVKMISVELTNIFERIIKESGISTESIYNENINLYEETSKFRSIDELSKWFKYLYNNLLTILEASQIKGDYSATIKKAIEFILNNYSKDISLSDVSKAVDVSPQYLSKLFKEECGKGFVNFLSCIRIEQAKKLLKEGVKIKDLAEQIGFNNYTYFFTVFKDVTGMTPQQYEKKLFE